MNLIYDIKWAQLLQVLYIIEHNTHNTHYHNPINHPADFFKLFCKTNTICQPLKKENIFHPLSVTAIEMWQVIPETNFFLTFHVNFCVVIDIFMMNKQVFNVTLA